MRNGAMDKFGLPSLKYFCSVESRAKLVAGASIDGSAACQPLPDTLAVTGPLHAHEGSLHAGAALNNSNLHRLCMGRDQHYNGRRSIQLCYSIGAKIIEG